MFTTLFEIEKLFPMFKGGSEVFCFITVNLGNYVRNASGKALLEFLSGTQEGSNPGSPIEYTFKVPEDGN